MNTGKFLAVLVWAVSQAAAQQTPSIRLVLNGASLTLPGGTAIAPGSMVSIFGGDLAGTAMPAPTLPLPASLAGVSVTIDGIPAPLLFVSVGQINAQAPWTLLEMDQTERSVPVVVTRDGRASAAVNVTVSRYSPALFTVDQRGTGAAVALNSDGTLAQVAGSVAGRTSRPARRGTMISISANGLGAVTPSVPAGQASFELHRRTVAPVEVLIGGRPAEVMFAGFSDSLPGAYQVNAMVPADAPTGNAVPIQARAGGVTSSDRVTIAVDAAAPAMAPAAPAATASAIWEFLTAQDFQRNFALWPGKGQLYDGLEPHGMLLSTYVNRVAQEAITRQAGTMPAGSLIVKENYMPDRTLAATTLMYKMPGFDPENGNWFYATRLPNGTIANEGRVAGCSGCHKLAEGNDYLYLGSIVPPPATNGAAFRDFLSRQNYQKTWRRWPGTEELARGAAPHGAFVTIYVNQVAQDAILRRTGKMPPGSIVVKENYTPDRTLAALTVMYKSQGFDPANNDWYWQMQMPDGRITQEGRVQGCINCHRDAAGNDFLFIGSIAAPPEPKAAAVWDHLQKESYQTKWKLMPGTQAFAAGAQPHGALVSIYVNPPAFDAITARRKVLPPGSMIVKENYMPDRTLAATTVMLKSEGYNPDHNDWYWLQRTAAGAVPAEGRVRGCINCHGAVANNDYIYLGPPR